MPDRALAAAFADEEHRGRLLAVRLRLAGCAVIALWIAIENPYPEVLFYEGLLLAFVLVGLLPIALPRGGRVASVARAAAPLLDAAIVACALLPNPFARHTAFPPQMHLRFGNEIYVLLLVCTAIFSYSPRDVVWSGVAAALVWGAIVLWVRALPDTVHLPPAAVWQALTPEEKVRVAMDPHVVLDGYWGRVAVVLLVMTAVLAAAVARSRRLVLRQAEAERQRANLSRYFSPNLVEELAAADVSFASTRTQDVAVLFVDLVGFTALSARQAPADVIELLRAFHRRMQDAVFAHAGTLDKYLGDGVMATFGTPRPGSDDATRALACARTMVAAIAAWNAERRARGEPALQIGVGVNHGPVIVGDVGGPQRLEFAVVGDTVNVASRLERLTRELGVAVVASAAAIETARREGASEAVLAGFRPGPAEPVRGREGAVAVWTLGAEPP